MQFLEALKGLVDGAVKLLGADKGVGIWLINGLLRRTGVVDVRLIHVADVRGMCFVETKCVGHEQRDILCLQAQLYGCNSTFDFRPLVLFQCLLLSKFVFALL